MVRSFISTTKSTLRREHRGRRAAEARQCPGPVQRDAANSAIGAAVAAAAAAAGVIRTAVDEAAAAAAAAAVAAGAAGAAARTLRAVGMACTSTAQ